MQDQAAINSQATARDMKKMLGLLQYLPSPPEEPTPWRYAAQSKELYGGSKFTIERINAISAQVLLDGVHLDTVKSAKDCPIRLGNLFVKVYATANDISDYSIREEL